MTRTNDENQGRTFRFACPELEQGLARALLDGQGYAYEPEPYSPLAMRLTSEPKPLGSSLANFFGLIYIQDKSSMLPPLMLDPAPGSVALDMCASPGGKTGILALKTGPEGFVLANEPNRSRLETLRRNLDRMNAVNTGTCGFPGQDLPLIENSWPSILLDPPCSGLGTLDKHPEAIRWQGEKAEPLVKLQKELLAHAARLLAPGGNLMYSTCTTNPAENEEQAAWALDNLPLILEPMDTPAGFSLRKSAIEGLQGTLPVDGEASNSQGFYLARFTKAGTPESPEAMQLPDKGSKLSRKDIQACADSGFDLDSLPPGTPLRFGDTLFHVHDHARNLVPGTFPWRGTPLGRFHKARFKPNPKVRPFLPATARTAIHAETVQDVERLLSGQALPAPDAPYAVLHYLGHPLCRLVVKGKRALWSER